MVEVPGDLERLDKLEEEVDDVVGAVAELRGQVMEVQRQVGT
jgi:tetrahydromethanopterin S-methyltransferase subunit G